MILSFYVCHYICILFTCLKQRNMQIKIVILLFSFLISSTTISSDIVILSSANVHGEIEPCGWKKKPLGGLARKATIIDNVKSEGYNPIIVDAGNLFFKSNKPVVGLNSEINKINANVIVESFNISVITIESITN